jgi:hypothetical protein
MNVANPHGFLGRAAAQPTQLLVELLQLAEID